MSPLERKYEGVYVAPIPLVVDPFFGCTMNSIYWSEETGTPLMVTLEMKGVAPGTEFFTLIFVAASATEPYISATAGVLRAALRTVRLSMFTGVLVASWFQKYLASFRNTFENSEDTL